jgi:hypothetical protein
MGVVFNDQNRPALVYQPLQNAGQSLHVFQVLPD